jgi:hypothetical protein
MIASRWTFRGWYANAVMLTLATVGCVAIGYQPRGGHTMPREGQTLVFGSLRFFRDGREFFPWNVSAVWPTVEPTIERHVWLLRLGGRAVSAEVHPDPHGSLAIWLASGDYALLGSTQLPTAGSAPYEVVALIRVPAGPVAAYLGELLMEIESHEGPHVSYSEFGFKSVTVLPIDTARATLEQERGTLPEPPALSPWCAGDHLPAFNDPHLATRAKELLDRGCEAHTS